MVRRMLVVLVALVVAPVASAKVDPALFNSMSFRLVGPFRGGRVTAVAGVPSDPMTYYMGSTGGGVWKTTDGGATWHNVSDAMRELEPKPEASVMGSIDPRLVENGLLRVPPGGLSPNAGAARRHRRGGDAFGVASIGAIAVAPSDPNVVYVGTGSACIRGNVSPGDGVYRSTDAGETWRYLGLPEAGQIGRIVVHPSDSDIVYVAVLGHAFGPNPERGVYRSTDGGLTWTRILFVSDRAGAVDLAMDPSNPRILFATTWEAERKPWTMVSGGPGSGLYKSADGGNTWVELTKGLPGGPLGKIGVAVSPAAPQRVWALVEAKDGGLFRSDDGGEKFRRVSDSHELTQRAWYYTHIDADPRDPNTVYVLNVLFWRSVDGGKTFTPIRTPHGDNHALWINPNEPQTMIEGNDGGATVTFDGGRTWSPLDNQPTAEMYRVTVDQQQPYWLYGGQQDNTAVASPSRSPRGAITREDWYEPAGCESATVAVDPRNPDITYGGCYGGSIGRFDRSLGHSQEVTAWPELAVGQQAKDLRYRFQWNAPIRISPHDPKVLYHCANVVLRSTDEGATWEAISPDLTRNDASKQGYAGGPITRDDTGVEVYDTIFAFEESPVRAGELWAGSDDGLVHLSMDDGATWKDVTPGGMPEWGTVNAIELSTHDPGRALIAVHRYRLDDFRPYIFQTDDYGASWRLLTGGSNGIPADHFVRVVREDPEHPGLLFAGSEFGLYVSFDDGTSWQPFQLDLPVTPITDLAFTSDNLVVATQGRSFWILDDLGVLRQLADGASTEGPRIFDPSPATEWLGSGGDEGPPRGAVGKNPPYGAVIHYALPADFGKGDDKPPEVKLEIVDSADNVLRTLSSVTPEPRAPSLWRMLFPELAEPALLDARPGADRYVWDLRLADPVIAPGTVLWSGSSGPLVPPGSYQARLTVGDWSRTTQFVVVPDPRVGAPPGAAEARYELARSIWEALNRTHAAIRSIRSVRSQVDELASRLDDEAVNAAAKELDQALTSVESRLTQPKVKSSQDMLNYPPQLDDQLGALQGVVESAEGMPTAGSRERFADLSSQLQALEGELADVLGTQLVAFEKVLDDKGVPRVQVPDTKRG